MGITINEALHLPVMKKAKLVAGREGIQNTIKWVTIVEVLVPEDIDRLQEGELLITTGFGILESEEKREVFHSLLSMKKLSGIALYTGFRLPEVPESFIEIANKHAMPILEIYPDINFSMITKEILEQIVNSQIKLLEYSHSIHERFTKLVLRSQGLIPITRTLSSLIQGSVILINDLSEIVQHCLIHHKLSVSEAESITMGEEVIRLPEFLSRSIHYTECFEVKKQNYVFHIQPIVANQALYGFIFSIKESDKWEKLDSIAIEHAATVYAFEFLKLKAVEETRIRLQGDYLEELLNESYINRSHALKRGKKLGLDLTLTHVVIYIKFDTMNEKSTNAAQIIDQLMKEKNRQTVIIKKRDALIVLVEVKDNKIKSNKQDSLELAQAIQDKWVRLFPKDVIKIGIGRVYSDLQELPKSAQEAEYSIHFSELLPTSKTIVHYEDLGHFHILIHMIEAGNDLRDFYENLIGPLFSHQRDDLLRTLEVYLHRKNMQITAAELFVHRQSLRYRLAKIEKITSLNLKSSDDQMKLQIAIMAYKLDRFKNPERFKQVP
ncbi:PucR family transcriptional regulator [Brevibacillus sp. NRS-1366]|uniref:PucR family transcriptional regulator n=1 Tax=Brevibacillus sp. NRS-1366 TaxID=3233899 RepID=UPI003D1C52DD